MKVKPQKAKKRVNWKKVAGLQKTEIDKLTEELMGLNEEIDKMYPDGIPEPGEEKKKAEEERKKKKKKKKKKGGN